MDNKEKAIKMYRQGAKVKEIYKIFQNINKYVTQKDRIERAKYCPVWTSRKSVNSLPGQNLEEIKKTYQRNQLLIKNFDKVSVNNTVTLKRKKYKREIKKEGLCIYKDEKIIVLQMKNYKEAFNIESFINYWKIEKIGGEPTNDKLFKDNCCI